jgi:hypothetical protein
MKVNENLEERLFSADIKALKAYDTDFDNAWQNGSKYEMDIKLSKLFEICPRKYARSREYSRLIRLLTTKNITLNVISRKNSNFKNNKNMKRLIFIDQFVFDANVDTKQGMEGPIQAYFDANTPKPGTIKFVYDKTPNGYEYKLIRYLPYGYSGDFVIDVDCSFLTGEPLQNFQIDLLNPSHKPRLYCVLGRNTDGYYIPTKLFEDFYKQLLSLGQNTEPPKKVKVFACDTMVSVRVDY